MDGLCQPNQAKITASVHRFVRGYKGTLRPASNMPATQEHPRPAVFEHGRRSGGLCG
jgi:hypothetical protein